MTTSTPPGPSAPAPSAPTPIPPKAASAVPDKPATNVRRRAIVVALILAVVGAGAWWWWSHRPVAPTNTLFVSGRIEGDESGIAPKMPGRLREVIGREGDVVTKGTLIALLDDPQTATRIAQAQAALAQAQSSRQHARDAIAVLTAQRSASAATIGQSQLDAEGRAQQAQGQLAAARAAVVESKASKAQADRDATRYRALANTGDVSQRVAEQAETAARTQAAAVAANQRQVDAALGGVRAAQANAANSGIREAQTDAVQAQIVQAFADVRTADAAVTQAAAKVREAMENRADLAVRAPFDGTITTRAAEPGEVIAAGTPIVTLVDLHRVYLRGFIPEGDIGRVRTGQPAHIYLDSAPSTPIDAVVTRIDPEASFTPENTYFEKDRVTQVVGVKLTLRGAYGFAKPGMPANARILVNGTSWTGEQGGSS